MFKQIDGVDGIQMLTRYIREHDAKEGPYRVNDVNHRLDGPYLIDRSGKAWWALSGVLHDDLNAYLMAHPGSDEEKMLIKLKFG